MSKADSITLIVLLIALVFILKFGTFVAATIVARTLVKYRMAMAKKVA